MDMEKKRPMAKIRYSILKVKEWLKFRKPDYEGFQMHVEVWEKEGMPYGFKDLLRIAKAYNCPLPTRVQDGRLIFEPQSGIHSVDLNFKILPTGAEFLD
jgi:hypothetical protein